MAGKYNVEMSAVKIRSQKKNVFTMQKKPGDLIDGKYLKKMKIHMLIKRNTHSRTHKRKYVLTRRYIAYAHKENTHI